MFLFSFTFLEEGVERPETPVSTQTGAVVFGRHSSHFYGVRWRRRREARLQPQDARAVFEQPVKIEPAPIVDRDRIGRPFGFCQHGAGWELSLRREGV